MTEPITKPTNETPVSRQVLPVAVIVLAMTSIAALCVFVMARALDETERDSRVNRDGISCLLEELSAHRQNSYVAHEREARARGETFDVPAPAPQPVPRELLAACDRFLQAPTS